MKLSTWLKKETYIWIYSTFNYTVHNIICKSILCVCIHSCTVSDWVVLCKRKVLVQTASHSRCGAEGNVHTCNGFLKLLGQNIIHLRNQFGREWYLGNSPRIEILVLQQRHSPSWPCIFPRVKPDMDDGKQKVSEWVHILLKAQCIMWVKLAVSKKIYSHLPNLRLNDS